jgi:hypothetical protein
VVEEVVVVAAEAAVTVTTTLRLLHLLPLRLRPPAGHLVGLPAPAPVMVIATAILRLRPRVGLLAATPETIILEAGKMEMTPETKILEPLTQKQKLLLPKPPRLKRLRP